MFGPSSQCEGNVPGNLSHILAGNHTTKLNLGGYSAVVESKHSLAYSTSKVATSLSKSASKRQDRPTRILLAL